MDHKLSVREQQKQAVRNRIINAALDLFLEKGYVNMQMREVYLNAEIGKKTLYRYFSSKEELAFAVEMTLLAAMADEVHVELDNSKTGYEQVEELLCDHLVSFIYDYPKHIRFFAQFDNIMVDDYPEMDISNRFVSFIQSYEDQHAELISKGQSDGSIRLDINPRLTSVTFNNAYIALAERIVLRGKILEKEYGIGIEMMKHLMTMHMDYLKNS